MLALADPYSSLTHEEVSFPGRRIALMIDASSSMMARFPAAHLNAKAPNEATFFTTVAAAETFIRQRMSGKYHDLIGLIEFGDEAYVVTPFTSDYDNILLSLLADRRLDRVHEVSRSGHDDRGWRSSRAPGCSRRSIFSTPPAT